MKKIQYTKCFHSFNRSFMYILEGNIGAGKSTLLQLIKEQLPHIPVMLEPVEDWQKQIYGQSLLTNFYQNSKRWAYTFETFTMMNRAKEHITLHAQNSIHIVERSVYSGFYCFARNSYEQGFMSPLEWELYLQWYDWLVAEKCMPPRGFIYMRVDPTVAYERIRKRNRYAEKTVPLSYLKQIHTKHEDFLLNQESVADQLKPIPVLTLECNEDFVENPLLMQQTLKQLEFFIYSTAHVSALPQASVITQSHP
jgi:deoxyadenosine/deoxycytidine kinase